MGIGVGNGMTAPEIQYLHYAEYAYKNSMQPLVSKTVYETMKAAAVLCVEQIKRELTMSYMYVYVYIYIHVYVYIYTCICIYIYIYLYRKLCTKL